MQTLDDIGLEIVKYPIKKVRVQFHAGLWYVEYQRKPKYYFDQWWWFDDSIHSNYSDAAVRAQVLTALGYFEKFEKKKQFILEVKG